MRYAIIDVETTGGRPKESKITEIAIYIHDGEKVIDSLCTLINPEMPIPEFIVRLTGISDDMVANAPRFFEVAKQIVEITEGCVFVAHNVGFDYGMIRGEFRSLGYDYRRDQLCTVRASRYVLPGFESYSLGKLCRALGLQVQNRHRASGDALATTQLFDILLQKTEGNLSGFIHNELNTKGLNPNLDLNSIDDLPEKTGVYKLFDEDNQLIYIGKSKSIKKRVEQHLSNFKTNKNGEMRKEICRAEFILTGSELIALLLESKLIKQHRPKYNRMLRKSRFSHGLFKYTDQNGYTCLHVKSLSKALDIPLTSFASAAEGSKILHAITDKYTLCQKLNGLYKSTSSCFRFQTKECNGACIKAETAEQYNERVQLALDKMEFSHDNFIIIDKGRTKTERSIVWVERGSYIGFGFVPFPIWRQSTVHWREFLELQVEDKDDRAIISLHLRKTEDVQMKVLQNT
jgi:DNA polymerase-3 subunit epsilon